MFMHDKPKRAFSALGCVTATRYKISGSLVTPRFSGLPQGELETLKGTKVTDGLSVDDGRCRWVKRRQVFGENSCLASGPSLPENGEV